MANRERFKKRAYLRYFARNASGEYAYTGGYYSLEESAYRPYAVRLAVYTALTALCAVLGGVLELPGMQNCFHVIIPYIFEVGFAGSVVWGAVRYFSNAKPLREYIYTATAGAFHWRALLTAVFAGAGAIAGTVFLILSGEWRNSAIVFYLLKAAVIVCMLLLRRYARNAEWKTGPAKQQI